MPMARYIRTVGRVGRERLAGACGTSVGYLYQIAGGHRRPSVPLALRLERHTGGWVCRCALRPDVFPPRQCRRAGHRRKLPRAAVSAGDGP